jgi:hypothetical protein
MCVIEFPQQSVSGLAQQRWIEEDRDVNHENHKLNRIFISYRREDSMDQAQAIRDILIQRFGADRVFLDLTTLEYGEDYRGRISREIESAAVQLVVIGPKWLTITNEQGIRINQPGDIIIHEITAALKHGIPIIPLIVNGADFPKESDLPERIRPLALRNGKLLRNDAPAHFAADLEDVIQRKIAPIIDPDDFVHRIFGEVECITGPVCQVPAATFQMGSATGNEAPAHPVMLPGFAIARYPVTVMEYARFLTATKHPDPHTFGGVFWHDQMGHERHPVVNVSWHDAVAYAAWLAHLTGQAWRLPTEAEWEYAARGTDRRPYPWGNTFSANRCNTAESHSHGTTAVGKYPNGTSPFGAQDMAGNVWEWTSSLSKPYPYDASDGREDGNNTGQRIVRGGSWRSTHEDLRSSRRLAKQPNSCDETIGFRLAISDR